MNAPGALIRIPITLVGDADLAKFESLLDQLAAGDPQVEITRTPDREDVVIGGVSELHLELTIDWLKRGHGLHFQVGAPQVAYLETITRPYEADYTHKRQSGGTGQFARIRILFEPLPLGSGFMFMNSVVGGSVPTAFVPGVEKGLEAARNRGLISGFPVTDFRATLLDGAHHEVDSSAAAFQIAAHDCFGSISHAHVAMLEPIMQLEAEVPADAVDSVISDLKTRRAMTLRTRDRDGNKLVTALVPLSNLFGYENQVRGLTKGAGASRMKFDHYARIPSRWDPDDPHPGAAIGLRPA